MRYIAAKALFIAKKIRFINKKQFAAIILEVNNKMFIVHQAILDMKDKKINIYLLMSNPD